MRRVRNWLLGLIAIAMVVAIGGLVARRLTIVEETPARGAGAQGAIPVEVAMIEHGPIEQRRVFSGAFQATASVTIAPKVAGRILSLPLDVSDRVTRGQIVARLDGEEYEQAVMQAQAELAVANAEKVEADNGAEIAQRELDRVRTLHERGVASESQLDTVRANHLSKQAAVAVAKAQVTRAEAALRAAEIRRGYVTIRADWEGGDEVRVVAERFVEEGDTVSANTRLLSIIELDPIEAAFFATEREYALLAPGQQVTLSTDAYPDRQWQGHIARVAPIFREGSRQARVEVIASNEDEALKPGMFTRIEAVLGRQEEVAIVPAEALVERDGRDVIFVLADGVARLTPVRVGIREGGRVQVIGDGLDGQVVTLGQQLLDDGSTVSVPSERETAG